jgi:hypothetical protein
MRYNTTVPYLILPSPPKHNHIHKYTRTHTRTRFQVLTLRLVATCEPQAQALTGKDQ